MTNVSTRSSRLQLAAKTIATAWHDGALVGFARVISDGYLYAALADIGAHPDYQRQGVGRQLTNRAFDATPKGVLYVNARSGKYTVLRASAVNEARLSA